MWVFASGLSGHSLLAIHYGLEMRFQFRHLNQSLRSVRINALPHVDNLLIDNNLGRERMDLDNRRPVGDEGNARIGGTIFRLTWRKPTQAVQFHMKNEQLGNFDRFLKEIDEDYGSVVAKEVATVLGGDPSVAPHQALLRVLNLHRSPRVTSAGAAPTSARIQATFRRDRRQYA